MGNKIKNNKLVAIISFIVTLLPIAVGLLLWDKLPDEVATHFNASGVPDSYDSKGFAVFGVAIIMLVVQVIMAFALGAEDKNKRGIPNKVYVVCLWICPATNIFAYSMIYANALGITVKISFWVLLFIGILFIVLGSVLRDVEPGKYVGVRVKWTRESAKNWRYTNDFACNLFMITGLAVVIAASLNWFGILSVLSAYICLVVAVVVTSVGSVIFSYAYYRKHKADEDY